MPRTPLTTNQHILHLLLTVFTFGLWLPVWIILSIRGNMPACYRCGRPFSAHAASKCPPPIPPYAGPRRRH